MNEVSWQLHQMWCVAVCCGDLYCVLWQFDSHDESLPKVNINKITILQNINFFPQNYCVLCQRKMK